MKQITNIPPKNAKNMVTPTAKTGWLAAIMNATKGRFFRKKKINAYREFRIDK